MQRPRPWPRVLIPVLAAVLALALPAPEAAAQRVVRVTASEAQRANIEEIEWAVGIIESRRAPQVAAEVAGRVRAVHVDEGQGVEAGEVLAELDTRQYTYSRVEQRAELRRLQALLRNQELEYQRVQRLFGEGLVARDQVDAGEAELNALREQVDGAKARLADSTRRLDETRIIAPVRSEISVRHIDVGDYVQAGTAVFDLIDMQNLRVRLPFPEYRAPRIRKGQEVRLTSAAAGEEPYLATITEIRPSVNPANRSIAVIVDFENPGDWRPGASVRAEVVLDVREDAIMVPQIAVVRRPAGEVVYVIEDGIARERAVKRGLRNGRNVEIREGLAAGEQVVVDGAGFLSDGAPVALVGG